MAIVQDGLQPLLFDEWPRMRNARRHYALDCQPARLRKERGAPNSARSEVYGQCVNERRANVVSCSTNQSLGGNLPSEGAHGQVSKPVPRFKTQGHDLLHNPQGL